MAAAKKATTTKSSSSSSSSKSSSSSSSKSSSSSSSSTNKFNPNTGKALKKGETVTIKGTNQTVTEGKVGVNSSSSSSSSSSKSSSSGSSSSVNNFNPNTGAQLKPGEVVKDNNSGKYIQQGTPAGSYVSGPSGNAPSGPVISSNNLKNGASGAEVKALQEKLISLGYNVGSTGADGKFGANTEAAVRKYQSDNGLSSDGIVGTNTAGKMNSSSSGTQTEQQPGAEDYVVQEGDMNDPFTGEPLGDVKPGTVIRNPANVSSYQEDYSKSGDTQTSLYGQPQKNSDWEMPAFQEQKAIVKAAGESKLVDSNFLKTISSDPSLVSFYVNALAYGGYTMGDVLNDMKRRELISKGDVSAKDLKIIDPEMNRASYLNTSDGQKSVRETATKIPTFNVQGLLNPDILKYGTNIPDELFKTLVPLLDRNSKEFKDAVANVKSAFYDLANAQLQAGTEQEKAVADYNYKNFKEQINTQYGIQLSDDATKAWKQIEDLENSMSQRGISGSGLEAEGVDDILQDTRKQDQRARQEKLTREEQQKALYYTSSASAAEVAALSEEERIKWGLKPSADILAQYSMSNLKAKYPDQSDEELKAYRDSVIDEYGNYRSTLYAKKYTGMNSNNISKKAMAETEVLTDATNKEAAAYRNYDQSSPFSVATKQDDAQVRSAASDAASNITAGFNSTSGPGSTPSGSSSTVGGTFSANQPTYTVKAGDKYSPYDGSAINSPVGTVITKPGSSSPSTSNTNLNNVINIDSNPGQKLQSGQKYSYQGKVYTQP